MMPVKSLALGALGVSIFGMGWETGKVMSPYYVATPIIFQDQQPAAGGSKEALQALLSPTPTSAPAHTQSTQASQGTFVASKNSSLFHDTSCAAAKSIKPENRVWFDSIDQARAAGYSPSACTQKLYNIK